MTNSIECQPETAKRNINLNAYGSSNFIEFSQSWHNRFFEIKKMERKYFTFPCPLTAHSTDVLFNKVYVFA